MILCDNIEGEGGEGGIMRVNTRKKGCWSEVIYRFDTYQCWELVDGVNYILGQLPFIKGQVEK